MTTRSNGRPAATTSFRPSRFLARLPLVLALCAPALASATPVDDEAPFPTRAAAQETGAAKPSLSARALNLALDVNRLVSPAAILQQLPGDAAAVAADGEAQGKARSVLQKALALLGTPYRWGGTEPDKGFDCSGLVGYVFRNALGVELPRVSRDMAKSGQLITERAKLAAGDLVFFGRRGRVDHVGIYVGEGRFVHAPSRGKDVTVSSLTEGYWSGRFMQARRVETGDGG